MVEGLLGDIYYGVPCQDDLEGTALSLIAQHHQQNAYLSDVFSKQKKIILLTLTEWNR